MFFNAQLRPTKTKHAIYLASSTTLGILLSVLVHVMIEALYLRWAQNVNHAIVWYGQCSLHPVLQIGLLVVGAIGGLLIGRIWWQFVYIDRRWAKRFGDKQEPSGKK